MESRGTKLRFGIDRGGTFTDVVCEEVRMSDGMVVSQHVEKLLSRDVSYEDAPREGIRRVLERVSGEAVPRDQPIPTQKISEIRMGTTVATNALLERQGTPMAFLTSKGFQDVLYIGDQSRPDIFALNIRRPEMLYSLVLEIDERVRVLPNDPEEAQEILEALNYPPVVQGKSGENVAILQPLQETQVREALLTIRNAGLTSLAVALIHAYTFVEHEQSIARMASEMGFEQISLSSELMPMVRLVPRAFTSCADAYLTPCIREYINTFVDGFHPVLTSASNRVSLKFMQSDGGLADAQSFNGYRAVLSGPAGGVVGYARATRRVQKHDTLKLLPENLPILGFDMGGTSTDVSRFDDHLEHVLENCTAGVVIRAPQLDIQTVAAGGGSRLHYRQGMMVVGPDSAGALPGPACYRCQGPLALTDANLVLGRLLPSRFPSIFGPSQSEPLSLSASQTAFNSLRETHDLLQTNEQLAAGFVQVANEAMCRPIRALTQARGHDPAQHVLTAFGGAAAQHACALARTLGIRFVLLPRHGSLLSAVGIAAADSVIESQQAVGGGPLRGGGTTPWEQLLRRLARRLLRKVRETEGRGVVVRLEPFLYLRYEGTDAVLMIGGRALEVVLGEVDECDMGLEWGEMDYEMGFKEKYEKEFGFLLEDRQVVVDDVRVRAVVASEWVPNSGLNRETRDQVEHVEMVKTYFEPGGWCDSKVFELDRMRAGQSVEGPALLIDAHTTVVLEPDCRATIASQGDVVVEINVGSSSTTVSDPQHDADEDDEINPSNLELLTNASFEDETVENQPHDPVMLGVFAHRFMSIAEEMGRVLQRTSISVNIKERLDYSCAIFSRDGALLVQAPFIPVHIGAMSAAVKYQSEHLQNQWQPGDVLLSNHPAAGGSHLPDLTVITPVFHQSRLLFFVANRGHHADIGGSSPGSMPAFSTSLQDEGAATRSFLLVRDGIFQEKPLIQWLQQAGARCIRENISDLKAQVAANQHGIRLLGDLCVRVHRKPVLRAMQALQLHAARCVRHLLRQVARRHGNELVAQDCLDDGTAIVLRVRLDEVHGTAEFNFSGSGDQLHGNLNAPAAITLSAVLYCIRCLVGAAEPLPLNDGVLRPLKVVLRPGSVLKPLGDAAVVGGNVCTSQRLCDVILEAFQACAASQGCMNNLTLGNEKFGYYETIAGGAGAGPGWQGESGVHTHMTNTRITDVEVLERRYPLLLKRFELRRGSGGEGEFRGGDGVVREMMVLSKKLDVSILSERRAKAPPGMKGGKDGLPGRNSMIRKVDGVTISLGGKNRYRAVQGDVLRIETPGGGGYGLAKPI